MTTIHQQLIDVPSVLNPNLNNLALDSYTRYQIEHSETLAKMQLENQMYNGTGGKNKNKKNKNPQNVRHDKKNDTVINGIVERYKNLNIIYNKLRDCNKKALQYGKSKYIKMYKSESITLNSISQGYVLNQNHPENDIKEFQKHFEELIKMSSWNYDDIPIYHILYGKTADNFLLNKIIQLNGFSSWTFDIDCCLENINILRFQDKADTVVMIESKLKKGMNHFYIDGSRYSKVPQSDIVLSKKIKINIIDIPVVFKYRRDQYLRNVMYVKCDISSVTEPEVKKVIK